MMGSFSEEVWLTGFNEFGPEVPGMDVLDNSPFFPYIDFSPRGFGRKTGSLVVFECTSRNTVFNFGDQNTDKRMIPKGENR
jgi:hypothetical protein